ncbi:MAG: DUF6434 domain-containing protein [Pseudomonadota bacterium]
MSERPAISDCIDADTFRQWYFLKEELVAYARSQNISTVGGKFEIADRIAHFLETGERLEPDRKPKPVSTFDWHGAELTDATVITDNYKNTQNVRRYFKTRMPGFAFSIPLMDWMKLNLGKTLADAVHAAEQIAAEKKEGKKQPDQPHNQYNAYTRAYFAAVPDGSQEEVRKLWAARRKEPGPYVFDTEDVDRYRKNLMHKNSQRH